MQNLHKYKKPAQNADFLFSMFKILSCEIWFKHGNLAEREARPSFANAKGRVKILTKGFSQHPLHSRQKET